MKTESKYCHSDGITDIADTGDGKKFLTCGSDSDIRIWDGFSDQDPGAFSASDSCLSLLCFGQNVYVATEYNTIEVYELPNGKKIGVKAKFSAAVNHMDISKDGKLLIAGSADMTIQIIQLDDLSTPKKLNAHAAPVLSISLDPLMKYFASSGCDGTVNVWSLNSEAPSVAKSWENVFPKSNDISLTLSLCRMQWSPQGAKFLAIPEDNKIVLYSRGNWTRIQAFQCKDLTDRVSVVKYSNCCKFIAAGFSNGMIVVWSTGTSDLIIKYSFADNPITGLLMRSTQAPEVLAVDQKGRLYWLSDIMNNQKKTSNGITNGISEKDISLGPKSPAVAGDVGADDEMFDDMDDDLFGIPETEGGGDDDDDENEISISKIKAEVGFIGDEYVGVDRATKRRKKLDDDDDDRSSVASIDGNNSVRSSRQTMMLNPFTEAQKPFQPSSTPIHLEHRFLVWNNVGTMRSYSTDDDDAIDVEFHDPGHHNSMHLRNQFDYTMGTMSSEAIIFACAKGKDYPSKLFCINYATWDSRKEWTVDMPVNEEIFGIAIGDSWIAAATNLNRIHLYSLSGVQHFIYDIPGQVVALVGFNKLLFLTYHYGLGVHGSQSIFYSVFRFNGAALKSLIAHSPLPLSAQSALSWIGFSEEGTPAFSDTSDCLRILNGQLWTPFCNMREFLPGPNDHFWVVGLSQLVQNIRAVKCKGAKYPPTLPRPTPLILDAKIPLCELETEKSQLEDTLLRALMMRSISKKMTGSGFDTDEYYKRAQADLLKSSMKLFELSIKGSRDFRGSEYISFMPLASGVQQAVKLASQQRKIGLAERLRTIAQEKMEEESDEEVDEDFERPSLPALSMSSYPRYNTVRASGSGAGSLDTRNVPTISTSFELPKSCAELGIENPLLQKQKEEIRNIICPPTLRKSNPFKKSEADLKDSQGAEKGLAFIEAWKKLPEKPTEPEFNPKHPSMKLRNKKSKATEKETPTVTSKSKGSDKKKQATLFDMRGRKGKLVPEASSSQSNPASPAVNAEDENDNDDPNSMNGEATIDYRAQEGVSLANQSTRTTTKRKRNVDEAKSEEGDNGRQIPMLLYSPPDKDKKSKFASRISKYKLMSDDSDG